MAGNIFLKQGTSVVAVSSGGSLATATVVAANGASNLTNSTGLYNFVSARLVGVFGTAATEGGIISLYLAPKLDGTNVASFDISGTPPLSYLVGNFIVALATTGTQYMDIDGIPVTAYDYEPYIYNQAGQTLNSGWTLTFYPTLYQYT
jgi:hypothetical protein